MNLRRVLVTGAQGCVGSWVVKNLVEANTPTIVYDLESEPRRMALVMQQEEIDTVAFIQGDITDCEHLERVIKNQGVTDIVHLAALQHPDCRANPILGAGVNIVGTLNVFEAVKRCKDQVRQVVYASSSAALGPETAYDVLPVPDEGPLLPTTHYGVFKACNEASARVFWLNDGITSIGSRPGVIYGPGRDQGRSADLTEAIKAVLYGHPFHIDFGGRVNAQFVDDVAKIFIACANAEHTGAAAFNQMGFAVSVSEFVAEIERQVPAARGLVTYNDQNKIAAPSEVDDKGLRGLIGQVPATSVSDGIARTIEVFQREV